VSAASADWAHASERGSPALIRFMAWMSLTLGRPFTRVLLRIIAAYFLAFGGASRRNIAAYLRRCLGRAPTLAEQYRLYLTFASTLHDRIYFLKGRFDLFAIERSGTGLIGAGGTLMMGAHFGSFEAMRACGRAFAGRRVVMAMYEDNARRINGVLAAVDPGAMRDVVPLGRMESMLELRDRLDEGALVGVLADESPTIADATDDLTALVGTLSSSADDIDGLLARTPPVVSRMDDLLVQAYGDLRCTAAGAAAISGVIDTDETLRQLTRFLRSAESAADVIPKAIFEGPDGRYLSGTFGFAPGNLTATYEEYPQLPEPYPAIVCPGDDLPTATPGPDSAVGDGQGGEGTDPSLDGDEPGDGADEDAAPASSDRTPDADAFPWVGAMLALAAALAVAALAARIIRLRRS